MSSKPIIKVEQLVKKFGDLVAVNGINFHVNEGEVFGFLGPNGAGKTTTINILCTLLRPTSGRAFLNGYDVERQQNEVRRSIGIVFQDPSLDERLTAMDNLRFHAFIYGMPASVRGKRIEEVLRMVELWERRNHTVKTFSGGMKRRLEIARGLLHYPRVLFLDEPTLGLDPQTRRRIWEYITDLKKREGITVFLTTHYMEEAGNADRIAIIDYGVIVALDTPDALKGRVGGDVVRLKTVDNDKALAEIKEAFSIASTLAGNGLVFEVPKGDEFIPRLVSRLGTRILSISLSRPALDDVFLKLTGHEIRDQELDSMGVMKSRMQRRSKMGRGRWH